MKTYRVTTNDISSMEFTTREIQAPSPREAYEQSIADLGYAPHKFKTWKDAKESKSLKSIYWSYSVIGQTQLCGIVKQVN